jgi:hypothetical protein
MRLLEHLKLIQAFSPDEARDEKGEWTSGGSTAVHEAIEDWAGLDQDNKKLNAIMEKVIAGDTKSPDAVALRQMAKEAQDHFASNWPNGQVRLFRVELNTGSSLRQDSLLQSYTSSQKAAQLYLSNWEESRGSKLSKATITPQMVPTSRIVAYSKQSEGFIPNEKEVIVSKKAFNA